MKMNEENAMMDGLLRRWASAHDSIDELRKTILELEDQLHYNGRTDALEEIYGRYTALLDDYEEFYWELKQALLRLDEEDARLVYTVYAEKMNNSAAMADLGYSRSSFFRNRQRILNKLCADVLLSEFLEKLRGGPNGGYFK